MKDRHANSRHASSPTVSIPLGPHQLQCPHVTRMIRTLKKMNFLNGQPQYERPKHTLTSKGFSPVNVQKLRAPVSQVTQCCGRASVHSCCCNNTPRAEWPAKSSIYCPCFWRLGVSDQSTSLVGRGPSSRWQASQGRRGRKLRGVFYKRTHPIHEAPASWPEHPQRAHLLRGWGFQQWISALGTQHSDHVSRIFGWSVPDSLLQVICAQRFRVYLTAICTVFSYFLIDSYGQKYLFLGLFTKSAALTRKSV